MKVLKGPIYDGRLADYAARFSERRKEIMLALQIHATLGVDAANCSIANVHHTVRAVDEKLAMILRFREVRRPSFPPSLANKTLVNKSLHTARIAERKGTP